MGNNIGLYIKGVIKVPSEATSHRITLLPSPLALPATQIRYNSFYANWTNVTRATGYYLDVATDSSFTNYLEGYEAYDVGNVNTLLIEDLDPETDYYYRLRAYNDTAVSLRSNTIHVVTQAEYLQDKDGNNYTSIIIGSKEWIVENLRTTHYADGTPIPNLTENETVNLITGWTNSDWGTFSTSGPDITSAIKAAGSYGHATSNIMALTAGDVLSGSINCSLVSGSLGQLVLLKGSSYLHALNLVPGVNNFSWSITASDNYQLLLLSSMSGTSMSATVVANSLKLAGWVDDTVGAYCWFNNDIANKTPFGALYNWPAVNNAHGLAYLERGGVQEIDWGMPTIADYYALMRYYDSEASIGANIAGYHLKRPDFWTSGTVPINDSGFSIVGTGYRDIDGSFNSFLQMAAIWSKEENDEISAFSNYAYSGNDSFQVNDPAGWGYASNKQRGQSVRLVRDLD